MHSERVVIFFYFSHFGDYDIEDTTPRVILYSSLLISQVTVICPLCLIFHGAQDVMKVH